MAVNNGFVIQLLWPNFGSHTFTAHTSFFPQLLYIARVQIVPRDRYNFIMRVFLHIEILDNIWIDIETSTRCRQLTYISMNQQSKSRVDVNGNKRQTSRAGMSAGSRRSCIFLLPESSFSLFLLPQVPVLEFYFLGWSFQEATIWVLLTIMLCLVELFLGRLTIQSFQLFSGSVRFVLFSHMILLCVRTRVRRTS